MSSEAPKELSDSFIGNADGVSLDVILAPYQVASYVAFAKLLEEAEVLPAEDTKRVLDSLNDLDAKLSNGHSFWGESRSFENEIAKLLGKLDKTLKLGLTDNDRHALFVRLWLRDKCLGSMARVLNLREQILALAKEHIDVMIPGYSNLQIVAAELLPYWWLASASRLRRDFDRLNDCFKRVNLCPLIPSSTYLYKSNQSIFYQEKLNDLLGFDGVIENRLDAVCDRDSIIEITSCAALISTHISQLASELLIWSTQEFGYVRIPRSFNFGESEVMEKNRRPLQILRSRSSLFAGRLTEFLQDLKGIPVSFSQDSQELAFGLIEVFKSLEFILDLSSMVLPVMIFDTDRMNKRAKTDLTDSRAVMDYLMERGFDSETASNILEKLIKYCSQRSKDLGDLTLGEWQEFSPAFNREIYDYLSVDLDKEDKAMLLEIEQMQVSDQIERYQEILQKDRQQFGSLSTKFLNNPFEVKQTLA